MVKQAALRTVDLEPIDRLEDKIKLLVDMVTRLRPAGGRDVGAEPAHVVRFPEG